MVAPYSPQMPSGGQRPGTAPAPARPSQMPAPNTTGRAALDSPQATQINQALWQLWLSTGDPTIFEYIQSGWTTPVSPAVQQQVSQIVGRQVPTTQGGIGAQTSVDPAYLNPPVPGQQTSSAPATPPGQGATGGARDNQAGAAGYNDSPLGPPGATPAGLGEQLTGTPPSAVPANGGPATTPAGLGEQLTNPGPGNPPATPYQQGNEDFWNRLLANPPSSTPPTGPGNTSKPPITTPPGQQVGPGGVGETTPSTPTSSGSNPGGGPVNPLDPNSAVGQGGYLSAMQGDQTAQNAVMGKLLGNLGVDVTRPGLYTSDVVSTLMPYLTTFLRYFGLDNGKPAFDRAREAANQFGGMIGSAGTFGQLQDYGQSLVPGVQRFMQARGIQPSQQMGIASDLLGLLTAGNNAISQAGDRGNLMAGQQLFAQQALDQPGLNYLDFINQQQGQDPSGTYGALLRMLAGKS